MLVRDNTPCPNCGKMSATDVFVYPGEFWGPSNTVHVRAECFDCLGWTDSLILAVDLRVILASMASAMPASDPLYKYSKWQSGFVYRSLTRSQTDAVWRASTLLLGQGSVVLKLVKHPALQLLSKLAKGSLVHTETTSIPSDFGIAWRYL